MVSGIAQDFRGANNYRPNVTCNPMATPAADRAINNWFNRACVAVPTDPSQPFGNAGPEFRARTAVLAVRHGPPQKNQSLGGPTQLEVRFEAFNLLNRTNFRAPNGNRSAAGLRHDHVHQRSTPAAAGSQGALVNCKAQVARNKYNGMRRHLRLATCH